jgi:anti-sigma B factor antagonist
MQGAVSVPRPGTVVMSGEIDMAMEDQLAAARLAIDELTASAAGADLAPLDWTVDLRDVTFMDSTGLGFLAHAHRVLAERGCTLTVVGPPPVVMRTLTIVHLDEVLKIVDVPPADDLTG